MTDGPEPDATFDDHRQGDVVSLPIDVVGLNEGERAGSGERNVALISQTCDIVRPDRDYVIVAALTDLPATHVGLAERGSMPRYANLPAMSTATFIDLDHIATVPKSLLRGRTRIPGVDPTAWDQVRNLSRSIGRKFSRFAFPDAVVPWFDPLRPVIEKRHDKDSPLGRVLRAIAELRVESEDWSQSCLHVKLHVIVAAAEVPEPDDSPPSAAIQALIGNDQRSLEEIAAVLRPDAVNVVGGSDGALLWEMFAECLASLCTTKVDKTRVPGAEAAIQEIQGLVWSDAEFSLARYRLSEMLDLDHLSSPRIGL